MALPASAFAAPGDLDGTFSRDGLVTGGPVDTVADVAVAADDTILVAANAARGELTRLTPAGEVAATLPSSPIEQIAAIGLRPDGSIVVGGSVNPNDFALQGLGPNGTFVETDFAGGTDRVRDVVVAPDGSVVAAGTVTGPAGNQLGVARYLADGTLDPSFSADGKLILETGGASSFAKNAVLTVLADGSILLAGAGPAPDGSGRGDLLLAKLEPDGDLDPTFGGGDGFTTLDIDGRDDAASIAVGPDGEIVVGIDACAVGLTTDCNPALARFTSSGELDRDFGAAGVVVPAAGAEVQVLPNGSVFAAGTTRLRERFQTDFAMGRYLSNGTPDTSFSGDGVATADLGLGADRAAALALTGDGRPVLAGTTFAGSPRLALARFEIAPGPLDADADDRLDSDDRCPERYGPGGTGCPKIDRDLKLRSVRGGRLSAKLSSELDSCLGRQRVVVQVRERGRWSAVARGRTGSRGTWVTPKAVPDGRYRAITKQTLAAPLGRCARARSSTLSLG